jgi:hypothetical protein
LQQSRHCPKLQLPSFVPHRGWACSSSAVDRDMNLLHGSDSPFPPSSSSCISLQVPAASSRDERPAILLFRMLDFIVSGEPLPPRRPCQNRPRADCRRQIWIRLNVTSSKPFGTCRVMILLLRTKLCSCAHVSTVAYIPHFPLS